MPIHIYDPASDPPSLLAQVADLHAACTTDDPRTIATWRPPYTPARRAAMTAWYADQLKPVPTYGCALGVPDALLVRGVGAAATSDQPADDDVRAPYARMNTLILDVREGRVVGSVVYVRTLSESGPQRAGVRALSVDPTIRRAGIARGLMAKLEEMAVAEERWLITLATARESNAYAFGVYVSYGYTEWGIIPEFVVNPATEQLMAEANYYKDLRKTPPVQARRG